MQKIIVGIDEAGRGPLAGPVVAAAFTVLNPKFEYRNSKHVSGFVLGASNLQLRDSKLLSPKQRELIYEELCRNPDLEWGIGQVSEKQIDKINILQATRLAMKRAFWSLHRNLQRKLSKNSNIIKSSYSRKILYKYYDELVIVDGNILLDLPVAQKAVVKADATIFPCMAASIIAKVTRDHLMLKLHKKYTLYGFDRHKGYGTTFHLQALEKYGTSPIHRRSFSPIRQLTNF